MKLPKYSYKCCECKSIVKINLPISTDPKQLYECECGYSMKRIITPGAQFPEKVGKVWAGDWFRKTYGHDIGEGAERKIREKESYERERRVLERDGVKITHRSRQVGGTNRIKIPDKKDD